MQSIAGDKCTRYTLLRTHAMQYSAEGSFTSSGYGGCADGRTVYSIVIHRSSAHVTGVTDHLLQQQPNKNTTHPLAYIMCFHCWTRTSPTRLYVRIFVHLARAALPWLCTMYKVEETQHLLPSMYACTEPSGGREECGGGDS